MPTGPQPQPGAALKQPTMTEAPLRGYSSFPNEPKQSLPSPCQWVLGYIYPFCGAHMQMIYAQVMCDRATMATRNHLWGGKPSGLGEDVECFADDHRRTALSKLFP